MLVETSLNKTLELIDLYNAQDPNVELLDDGSQFPKELIYGQRMSLQLASFTDDASEELQIAVRGQHIGRWKIPRSDYPMDRAGYKRWRTDLAHLHGQILADLMSKAGYTQASIDRVKDLVLKRSLKRDLEAQTLEDIACLVFLNYYFDSFSIKYTEEKIIDIVQKTWKKMSEKGHQFALALDLSPRSLSLITKALNL
ncbi:MAG: DUF4202 domain-containing protein [Cellvibrio sp.]